MSVKKILLTILLVFSVLVFVELWKVNLFSHTSLDPADTDVKKEIKVFSLAFIPIKNGKIDKIQDISNSQGEFDFSLEETRSRIDALNYGTRFQLTRGTQFHGYKEKDSKPYLEYNIVGEKEFLEPAPTIHKTSSSNLVFDYKKIMDQISICDLVDSKEIREIWIWSYGEAGKIRWESNFSSRYGDISNSDRDPNDLPLCNHSYTVYNYSYGRDVDDAVHDHIHQFESIFGYVDSEFFWDKFVVSRKVTNSNGCGRADRPPNASSDYDYGNHAEVQSNCENWFPDQISTDKAISCKNWYCTDLGFYVWWMQNIPGIDSDATYSDLKLRNWWDFIADFDKSILLSKSLTF